jgi:hypothetical protein
VRRVAAKNAPLFAYEQQTRTAVKASEAHYHRLFSKQYGSNETGDYTGCVQSTERFAIV